MNPEEIKATVVELIDALVPTVGSSDKTQTFLDTYLRAMQGAGGVVGLHDLYEKQ